MDENIWGNFTLSDEERRYFSIGDLHLWLVRRNEEIWIAYCYKSDLACEINPEKLPESVEWSRWAHKNVSDEINIRPVYPDMPLVVHSEYTLKISPKTQIQIYTRIPIWVRISIAENNYQLIELPTAKLSRTWFGTLTDGELCYHAVTKARRDLSDVEKKPHLVSCPIIISNRSPEELNFEHFCFRVERLSMFAHNTDLWADETQIVFQGEDLNSDVIMTGKLHDGVSQDQLLTPPRKKIQKSLATRTFKIFEDALTLGR
ncbi:DUF432 domain-containing protein [Fodinibius halophilus]|uniref:DUF432 domain-containing protein n=1 Tax=Fodinibius halophilus TaxID=1736908 RepID=A0A6M1T6P8_9BACT|nr:DUF432 domain-containing protein [Fodinibius halophilus]NGP88303.1 DUF432 domain-containing protein [Fodinibius halophilus]